MHVTETPYLQQSPQDGWLGTREFPGYRAGNIVARLDHLPEVDAEHLYFDLLLLDSNGRTRDNHSGTCRALTRRRPVDDRSRYVRVVAELVRHSSRDARGLAAIGPALSVIRERGIESGRLNTAAQLLDDLSSEPVVVANLSHLLELSLGPDEARQTMCEVVAHLARASGFGPLDALDAPPAGAACSNMDHGIDGINDRGLTAQTAFVVRIVGKTRARHFLRDTIDFELLPRPDLLGV